MEEVHANNLCYMPHMHLQFAKIDQGNHIATCNLDLMNKMVLFYL